MTEVIERKTVSGCKNPFQNVYIAVLDYGSGLLLFCQESSLIIIVTKLELSLIEHGYLLLAFHLSYITI